MQGADRPRMVKVERVVDETPTVRTLEFRDGAMAGAQPGQFAMVWIPGVNELPMSVMVAEGGGRAAFTVRRHGPASAALYGAGEGAMIGVRGPYGNSFDVRRGRLLLVGGGTGLVPMMRLLTRTGPGDDVTLLIGARTREEVFFEQRAGALLGGRPHRILVTTDDGSYGEAGRVTGTVERLVSGERFDAVYACGPELMMAGTVQAARSRGVFVQASLERMMKCGVGICGSCCAGEDLVCRDGTVFDGGRLAGNPDFGRVRRTKSGIPEAY